MPKPTQSDDAISSIVERCRAMGFEARCVKCGRTFATIRQTGDGLPLMLRADGPCCANCRTGKTIGVVIPRAGLEPLRTIRCGSTRPLIRLASSGQLCINRAACDLYGFPPSGHVVFAWDGEQQRIYVGLGGERDDGARPFTRKDSGEIMCSVKTMIQKGCGLEISEVRKQAPWVPEYDEETGLLFVQLKK